MNFKFKANGWMEAASMHVQANGYEHCSKGRVETFKKRIKKHNGKLLQKNVAYAFLMDAD